MKKVEIKTNPERLKSLVVGDKVFRSSFDYELSPEDVEQARRELKETEEVRNASLRTLKEMLSRDEFRYCTDDDYLLTFLRYRKFDCNEAHKLMHFVYTFSKDHPDVFATLPPKSDLEAFLDSRLFSFLPYRDEEGSVIFVNQFATWTPKEQSIHNLFQCFQPTGDIIQMNPSCQINKVVGIFDAKGLTLEHITKGLYPPTIWFALKTWQNFFTFRIKYIFYVNCNKLGCMFYKAVRHLLKKKFAERIVVIGTDMKELHKYINPAILPKEYGGSLDDSAWNIKEHILDNLPYVEYQQSFRRPKKI